MHPITFVRMFGMWVLLFSCSLLPPVVVSALYSDGELPFFIGFLISCVAVGGTLWFRTRRVELRLHVRESCALVVMLWFVTSLLGAVPFVIHLGMSPVDAFFESVSALTTTGATVITGLDSLPYSVLFFRQEMQWLGGMGVVVFAIALVPMLGFGGMQLMKAEVPGPIKDEKLAPRVAQTASILWKIYLGLTITCALAYWFAGMTAFDAVAHSFSTVSTGGFSTHDASIAYFDSVVIETIAVTFMLLGSLNFGVHFASWRGLTLDRYWDNEEVRAFLRTVGIIALFVSVILFFAGEKDSLFQSFRYGLFTTVSVISSTGFGIDNFAGWWSFLPVVLIFTGFIGGCGGSTAGGIKVVRLMIMVKSAALEITRLVHPRIIRPIKFQGRVVEQRVIDGAKVFLLVYLVVFAILMLVLLNMGMDLVTVFSAVATCINNLGPGLGAVASNFQSVPDGAKWVLAFAMLLGRLELFTLIVLFSPTFWKN